MADRTCPCGGALPGRRRLFCSDVCARRASARYWRDRAHQGVVRRTNCLRCGWAMTNRGPRSRNFCSKRCADLKMAPGNSIRIRYEACRCGALCVVRGKGKRVPICSECIPRRRQDANRRRNVKRRRAPKGQAYTLVEIGMRDGWRCHLCGKKVDRRLPATHSRGPTIDHLVPISAGGIDDPSNVALAHKRCNLSRGAGGQVQLRLVG